MATSTLPESPNQLVLKDSKVSTESMLDSAQQPIIGQLQTAYAPQAPAVTGGSATASQYTAGSGGFAPDSGAAGSIPPQPTNTPPAPPATNVPVTDDPVMREQELVQKAIDQKNEMDHQFAGVGAGGAAGGELPKTTTGGGTNTGGGTTDITAPDVGTTSEYDQKWKEYSDQASNMKFEWNPATDPDYLQQASQLEQQVTNMMVGRGGLYSSVFNSALQSRMIELQVGMREQRYNEFLQERAFVMQQAEFYANRSDADFSRKMQELNYKLDYENQKFQQEMTKAEQNLAWAKFNYSKEQAKLAEDNAQTKLDYSAMETSYTDYKSMFDKYQKEWADTGKASYEVAQFFDVDPMEDFNSSTATKAINNGMTVLDQMSGYAQQLANQSKDQDSALSESYGFVNSATQMQTMAQESKYNTLKYNIFRAVSSASEAQSALSNLSAEKDRVRNTIGEKYYTQLYNDVQALVKNYQRSTTMISRTGDR